ncbi:SAF domain-containing protein [Bacillus sp. FJAT-50079]|uniref:Flp pilus assembly protein CpaB n=1 Tax=Bacillus sp. FJAT-50079 TaxID=2833577 RepID=UPI001BC98D1D|nr:SAF domain-containing protein [Bacillus sp. FJAT-50079]MBS4210383.1 flagella basal body P-ring formation protein FlgA [Bacillus sp. FJAT-50079]
MLESKRKAIIFFVISLLLALTAGFLILKKVQSLNTNLGTMAEVVVANVDVSSRALIRPEDVTLEEIPQKYLKEYHITNVEELINKVSIVPLSAGDMITKNMLKQASAVVEENNRLITLMESDRIIFDEPLEALDRVDIIVSHRFDNKEETSFFMKDVKVSRVAKESNKFKGVQLEIPLDTAPQLIHMQNYADSVRIVKANVGKLEAEVEKEMANPDLKVEADDNAAKEEAAKEQAVEKAEEAKEENEAEEGKAE